MDPFKIVGCVLYPDVRCGLNIGDLYPFKVVLYPDVRCGLNIGDLYPFKVVLYTDLRGGLDIGTIFGVYSGNIDC